MSRYRTWLKR